MHEHHAIRAITMSGKRYQSTHGMTELLCHGDRVVVFGENAGLTALPERGSEWRPWAVKSDRLITFTLVIK